MSGLWLVGLLAARWGFAGSVLKRRCLARAVGEAQNLCSLTVALLVFEIGCWS